MAQNMRGLGGRIGRRCRWRVRPSVPSPRDHELGPRLEEERVEDEYREGGDQQGGLCAAGGARPRHGHPVDACSWSFGVCGQ